MRRLLIVFVSATALFACKQAEGERCFLDTDCDDQLVCCVRAGNLNKGGTCETVARCDFQFVDAGPGDAGPDGAPDGPVADTAADVTADDAQPDTQSDTGSDTVQADSSGDTAVSDTAGDTTTVDAPSDDLGSDDAGTDT